DFLNFFAEHLSTSKIVFSCVGNISHDEVERVARKYLEGISRMRAKARRKKFRLYRPQQQIISRPVKQAKCAIGRDAYPIGHENRVPLYLLVNMLGGPGMNSRLNLALRERHGYVYSIDAHYIPYTDTGMFAVFFGTEPRQLDRCISLVRKELDRFCEKPLTKRQLAAAKEQIKGQLAIGEENNLGLMLSIGRSVLDLGRVPSLEEIYRRIDEIDAVKLQEVAQDIFDEQKLSYLIMQPDFQSNGHHQ